MLKKKGNEYECVCIYIIIFFFKKKKKKKKKKEKNNKLGKLGRNNFGLIKYYLENKPKKMRIYKKDN
jgi:hypothetical protein